MWRSLVPSRRAATMNSGRTITPSSVSRHSSENMTIRIAVTWIRLVTMSTIVLLIARWASITSLFRRLISSPVLVCVKKRSDRRCRCV